MESLLIKEKYRRNAALIVSWYVQILLRKVLLLWFWDSTKVSLWCLWDLHLKQKEREKTSLLHIQSLHIIHTIALSWENEWELKSSSKEIQICFLHNYKFMLSWGCFHHYGQQLVISMQPLFYPNNSCCCFPEHTHTRAAVDPLPTRGTSESERG